jgi:hypothetical protein
MSFTKSKHGFDSLKYILVLAPLILVLFFVFACGVKGPPLPPIEVVPLDKGPFPSPSPLAPAPANNR